MKTKVLREKNESELAAELSNLIKELQNLKFKRIVNVVENPLKIRIMRRDIAKIKTLLHEKELEKLKSEIEKKA